MPCETPGSVSGPPEPDLCPLGVPAVMCINYEVTGWGCAECARPSSRKDSH